MDRSKSTSPQYQPPFSLTSRAVSLVGEISQAVGRIEAAAKTVSVRLRRTSRIRTIQGSLAIEGNTLTTDQITALLDGKRVLAPVREIQEARNAILAYERLENWDPQNRVHLLDAHSVLMKGLVDDPGKFRTGGVGIMRGQEVLHLAPPAERVPALMADLMSWLSRQSEHPLIASSVFHYEFEFIHPFSDGNGRMGRLWQSLLLTRWNSVFAFIPVETMIHGRQAQYYAALNQSTASANCGVFIDFMLEMILEAIRETATLSEKPTEKMSEKILNLLADDPTLTIADLASNIGVSTRTVERALQRLQTEARLRRVGPDKGGHWEVPL